MTGCPWRGYHPAILIHCRIPSLPFRLQANAIEEDERTPGPKEPVAAFLTSVVDAGIGLITIASGRSRRKLLHGALYQVSKLADRKHASGKAVVELQVDYRNLEAVNDLLGRCP